jgi:hypothetical protein
LMRAVGIGDEDSGESGRAGHEHAR